MSEPLAYHVTWTTHGSWLHGNERGWVESGILEIQSPDPEREALARMLMNEPPITLSDSQRTVVEKTIRDHCEIRGWKLHALNVRTNHVHLVVTADRDPEEVMNQLKAWTSRKLSDQAGLVQPRGRKAGRKKWWTEHGSTKWISDVEYLENAIRYVIEQQ